MGIRPHIQLICGTDTFPVSADGTPIIRASWDGSYPCYCPPDGVDPISEWSYWTHVPLPECPDMTSSDLRALSIRDVMAQGNRRVMRSLLERKAHDGVLDASDVLFRGDNEYNTNAHVIGYVLDECSYDSDMTWAWLSLHPEMLESGGYLALPTLPLEAADGPASGALQLYLKLVRERAGYKELTLQRAFWRERRMSALHDINRKKREFRDGQVYANFSMQLPGWLDTTLYLFNWMGFHVRRRDLRLLLVWSWG